MFFVTELVGGKEYAAVSERRDGFWFDIRGVKSTNLPLAIRVSRESEARPFDQRLLCLGPRPGG
jgi:hypothetical protein